MNSASQTSHLASNLVAFLNWDAEYGKECSSSFEVCTYMFYNSCGPNSSSARRSAGEWNLLLSEAQNTGWAPAVTLSLATAWHWLEIDKLQLHIWQWFVIIIWVRVRHITASYSTVFNACSSNTKHLGKTGFMTS